MPEEPIEEPASASAPSPGSSPGSAAPSSLGEPLDSPERAGELASSRSPAATLSRRRFLRAGLFGGALLGLGGLLAQHLGRYDLSAELEGRLQSLSAKEYRVIEAIAGRILRSEDAALPPPERLEVALYIDGFVSRLEPADRDQLGQLLGLIEHGLPLRSGRLGRFSSLDGEGQDAVLEAMRGSSFALLRAGLDALKTLCVMAYFRHPASWEAIGYDGPLVGRPRGGWAPP